MNDNLLHNELVVIIHFPVKLMTTLSGYQKTFSLTLTLILVIGEAYR